MGNITSRNIKSRNFKSLAVLLLALPALVLAYQNCGGKFEVSSDALRASACKPINISAESKLIESEKARSALGDRSCSDIKAYSCVVRHYSPGAENSRVTLERCLGGNAANCVNVENLSFDTAPARTSDNAIEFRRGGEYNRVDAECFHEVKVAGLAIAHGAGETVEVALANAIQSCEELSGVSP